MVGRLKLMKLRWTSLQVGRLRQKFKINGRKCIFEQIWIVRKSLIKIESKRSSYKQLSKTVWNNSEYEPTANVHNVKYEPTHKCHICRQFHFCMTSRKYFSCIECVLRVKQTQRKQFFSKYDFTPLNRRFTINLKLIRSTNLVHN